MAAFSTASDIIKVPCMMRMSNGTKAQVHNFLNTSEVPQSYKCAVKRLKCKTNYIAQNSDVENRAYVEVWAGGHLL
jgi:hypothetical protein